MKKYCLVISFRKKVIIQLPFSFTPDQQKKIIQQVIGYTNISRIRLIQMHICAYIRSHIGDKKFDRNYKKFEATTIQEFAEKYPDFVIMSHLQVLFGEDGFWRGLTNFYMAIPQDISGELGKYGIENFSWTCKVVE